MKLKLHLAVLVAVLLSISAVAGVPQQITYQGLLIDSTGAAVSDGAHSVKFTIWDMAAGGASLWNSGFQSVNTVDGLFSYNLGSNVALPNNLFASDTSRWLGVTVGADPEITPRTKFTSYGYAYQALRADTAEYAINLVGGGGPYLPLAGGTMTGPITNTGDPAITMGKGNFGTSNTNTGTDAFVSGNGNVSEGDFSTVGGGRNNYARGHYSVIGGGGNANLSDSNSASGQNTVIGGGRQNKATADIATVGGGGGNIASGAAATIGGGATNIASGTRSTASGGGFNFVRGDYSTIGGGGGGILADSNSVIGIISTIAGGRQNVINGDNSTIGGGGPNTIIGGSGTIGGGGLNIINATSATISGGVDNTVTSNSGAIGGGIHNVAGGLTSVVAGGNTNTASLEASTVGGGNSNTASGFMATVPGGRANTASGAYSMAGGFAANASGDFATVAGGQFNISDDTGSTVSGGRYNRARGWFSTVGGGGGNIEADSNSASGNYSTIPGGSGNTASGDYSLAAGRQAKALHSGTFVWADGSGVDFSSSSSDQFLIRATGGVGIGTSSPSGVLHIDESDWSSNPVRISGLSGSSVGPTLTMDARDGTNGNSYSIISTNSGAAAGGGKLAVYQDGPTFAGYRFVLDSTGNLGIGTPFPSSRLDVHSISSVVAEFNRISSDGTLVNLQQAGATEGTISVSGNTVSYNAFTGSHYGWTNESLIKGELVKLTGKNQYYHDNKNSEIIYGIEKSSKVNDPACLGAYLALSEPSQPYSTENPNLVMAVGNGEMWVVDDGRDIKAGDYLISSSTPGHAMRDDETRFPIGHIVARAAESVDWNGVAESIDGTKHKKISVLFGNFVRSNVSELNRKVSAQQEQIDNLETRLRLLESSMSKARAEK